MSFIRSRSTDSNISSTSENSNSESGYSSNSNYSNPSGNGNDISSRNKHDKIKPIQIDKKIYKPPYNSSWFETENDIPLETYIKHHLKIAHEQFSCNLPRNTTKGIIVPHSEIRVSGICSAAAYYQLAYRTTPIKRVILLCNIHHSSNLNPEDFNIYLPEYKYIQSFRNNKIPIQIDTKTINTLSTYLATNLKKKSNLKTNLKNDSGKQFYNNNIFENEHSFYTQLPFLEIIAPGAVICPIIIGSMMVSTPTNSYGIDLLNKFLAAVLAKSHTVIICTSNFTHYNINHPGIPNSIPNSIAQNIRKQDSDIMQFIYNKMTGVINKNRKIDLVDDFLFMSNTTAPGITALYIFSKLFNLLSINQNNSISYSNSTSSDSSDSSSQNQPKITSYYPRLASYYTSPIRTQTNLSSPNLATELLQLPTNLSITRESKSYAGIIISRQPYITDYDHISLTGLLTQFEKHVLHEFLRELIRGTISPCGIAPIFSGAFRLNLGVWVNLQKSEMDLISVGELDPSDESENMIMTLRRLAGQIRAKLKEPGMPDIGKLDLRLGLFNRSMMITPVEYFSDKFNPNQDIIQIKNPFKSSRRSGNAHILPLFFRGVQENKKQLLENLCLDVLGMDSRNCFRGNQTQLSYNAGLIF